MSSPSRCHNCSHKRGPRITTRRKPACICECHGNTDLRKMNNILERIERPNFDAIADYIIEQKWGLLQRLKESGD